MNRIAIDIAVIPPISLFRIDRRIAYANRKYANTRIKESTARNFFKKLHGWKFDNKRAHQIKLKVFPSWQPVITGTAIFYFVYTNKEADESASKNVCLYGYLNINLLVPK